MNDFKDWVYDNKGKVISLLISFVYIFCIDFFQDYQRIVGLCIFWGLICIWLGDIWGKFTGMVRGAYIPQETPGFLIVFLGWMILFLPLVIRLFSFFFK